MPRKPKKTTEETPNEKAKYSGGYSHNDVQNAAIRSIEWLKFFVQKDWVADEELRQIENYVTEKVKGLFKEKVGTKYEAYIKN